MTTETVPLEELLGSADVTCQICWDGNSCTNTAVFVCDTHGNVDHVEEKGQLSCGDCMARLEELGFTGGKGVTCTCGYFPMVENVRPL